MNDLTSTRTENNSITSHKRESMNILKISNLHAEIEDKKILNGIDLEIKSGEIHAIMGPNGSGKSTLCNVLMGNPKYEQTEGEITLNGVEFGESEADERANMGLFMAFQQPLEIPGVTLGNFLRTAKNANLKANDENAELVAPVEFMGELREHAEKLKVDPTFIGRSVNEGFSGGERKRAEILQMSVLKPKIALLDEIDSGLDIDALKIVAEGIKKVHEEHNTGILLITHYQRILNYVTPDHVHIMANGKIIKSGDKNLALELEEKGYEGFLN